MYYFSPVGLTVPQAAEDPGRRWTQGSTARDGTGLRSGPLAPILAAPEPADISQGTGARALDGGQLAV